MGKTIQQKVKEGYGKIAVQGGSCCVSSSCCGNSNLATGISKAVGYSDSEIRAVPEGANLGLGCGNPLALASIEEGEVVLDLGSGAGFDVFLAAQRVGHSGRVIGVDMTPEMIQRARKNAEQGGYKNVEFRLGEIEKLPVENNSVDLVISNCVINLSRTKQQVFDEAFRVLKPGGRFMISDLVLAGELPVSIKNSMEAYVGCIAGAVKKEDYLGLIKEAGFKEIKIVREVSYPIETMTNDATAKTVRDDSIITVKDVERLEDVVVSIEVSAIKPR
ncbi:MAG: arsenite methyltransferase [Candidatus Omnitrophica bacterium]|nr:arsenite methyltransferase [Candidatus Omnitrophota bacterium]